MPQNSRAAGANDDRVQRDNRQIQNDNQTSGGPVVAGQIAGDNQQPVWNADTPNQAANREPAEGSRENVEGGGRDDAGGVSSRPLSEEASRRQNLPPRGEAKEGSHA